MRTVAQVKPTTPSILHRGARIGNPSNFRNSQLGNPNPAKPHHSRNKFRAGSASLSWSWSPEHPVAHHGGWEGGFTNIKHEPQGRKIRRGAGTALHLSAVIAQHHLGARSSALHTALFGIVHCILYSKVAPRQVSQRRADNGEARGREVDTRDQTAGRNERADSAE